MSCILLDCISNWFFNFFTAHTKDSAKALVDTIQMAFPEARLALVIAMASDKNHVDFAREFLQGQPSPLLRVGLIFSSAQKFLLDCKFFDILGTFGLYRPHLVLITMFLLNHMRMSAEIDQLKCAQIEIDDWNKVCLTEVGKRKYV